MDLTPLIPIIAIAAFAAIRIARINADRGGSATPELKARVDELEQTMHGLQRELAETQERLDFAERLLVKGKG